MLIAMMGNTYALVIQQSEKEWVKQWAKIVIALERAVSQMHAKEYLVTYSIKVSGGSDGSDGAPPQEEVRGVMVIKSKRLPPRTFHSALSIFVQCQYLLGYFKMLCCTFR